MFTLPLGFIALAIAIFFSIELKAWGMFINAHAIIVVIGGTVALLAFTTPYSSIKNLFRLTVELFEPERSVSDHKDEFVALSQTRRLGRPSSNALINQAVELWTQGVSYDLFIVLLSQKRSELEEAGMDAIAALKNMAKYPPALGMTGTVVGMVGLFSNLGSDDQSSLGPALALAMTATFFGLIVANGFVQPLSDRLYVRHIQKKRFYKNIYQLLLLISNNEATSIVTEEVENRGAA